MVMLQSANQDEDGISLDLTVNIPGSVFKM